MDVCRDGGVDARVWLSPRMWGWFVVQAQLLIENLRKLRSGYAIPHAATILHNLFQKILKNNQPSPHY